jgi:ATP-dependent helicase HepA
MKAQSGTLILDQTGEDGLNLQFADTLIHADLPFDPNRLEQRTGRLDRLGRRETFNTHIPVGPEDEDVTSISPYWAWYRLVEEAFSLFDESTASLQFFFDEEMPEVLKGAFMNGPSWITDKIDYYKNKVEEEQSRIRKQDLLNTLDDKNHETGKVWDDLQAAEESWNKVFGSTHSILNEVWNFVSESRESGVQYRMGMDTMLPLDVQLDRFLPLTKRPITGRRSVSADSHGNVDLARPGTAWIERIREYQKWDDRGQAYALWRPWRGKGRPPYVAADPWWGFVFEILVEADIERAVQSTAFSVDQSIQALRRRGDGLFPPVLHSVVIDQHGDVVTDDRIRQSALASLDRDVDTNLHKHRVQAIDNVVPYGWGSQCRESHQTAITHVLNSPAVRDASRSAKRRISWNRKKIENRQRRRKVRGYSVNDYETKQLRILEDAISSPRTRVDTAGFIILSNKSYDEAN